MPVDLQNTRASGHRPTTSTLSLTCARILDNAAWNIARPSAVSYPSSVDGKLILPKVYRARSGTHKIPVSKGDDLNAEVYKYYSGQVDSEHSQYYGHINFRLQSLCDQSQRWDYLGVSPHVIAYRVIPPCPTIHKVKTSRIEIEWWDPDIEVPYTKLWVGRRFWKIEETLMAEGGNRWTVIQRRNHIRPDV